MESRVGFGHRERVHRAEPLTEGRFSRIVATDVSADALALARANAERVRPERAPEFPP